MTRLLRWAGYGLVAILTLLLVAAAAIWLISAQKLNASVAARPEHLAQPTQAQLADAPRMGRVLGCFSCHGEGLRGNKMFDQPMIGTVWAPNLTQVAAHTTDQQLAQAIRQGISDEGPPLIIMPSEAFQHLTDQELAALIHMIRAQPRSGATTPEPTLGPIGRLGVATGRFNTAPVQVARYAREEPARVGVQYEGGRRLAALYCASCHGPSLKGQEAEPGEMSPDLMIAGAYDLAAFKTLLRTGKPASGRSLPMMGPTARSDLSHMTDAEIEQLHAYLVARAQAATP